MSESERLTATLPSVAEVDRRIGILLRELRLARSLRRLAERARLYREIESRPPRGRQIRESATVAGR